MRKRHHTWPRELWLVLRVVGIVTIFRGYIDDRSDTCRLFVSRHTHVVGRSASCPPLHP
jgi:hypothetical protein